MPEQQRKRIHLDDDELAQIARTRGNDYVTEQIQKRQRDVLLLYLEGSSLAQIARGLGVSRQTIQRDIRTLQSELALERLPQLSARLDRAAATYRHVQEQAWTTYHNLHDNHVAQNKIAALKLVAETQESLDRLEGTQQPDSINARTVAAIFDAVVATLSETDPSGQLAQVFYEHLQPRLPTQTSALLVGAPVSVSAGQGHGRVTIDADEDDRDDTEEEEDAL